MGTGWSHVCSIQLDSFLEHRPTRCMDARGCPSRGSIDMFNVTNPIITNQRLGSRRAELIGFDAETVVKRECRGRTLDPSFGTLKILVGKAAVP